MVNGFIVEAGELIKIRYNFHNALREPFKVEAAELIKIRYNFQSSLWQFWVEANEAFTDMTRLVE